MSGERISCAIPSLINGISQQAQAFRLTSQCDLEINAMSSVLDGVSKRPPSVHMAKITPGVLVDPFLHTIDRDTSERYVVLVTNGNLRVFDILNNGAELPVSFPDGKTYLQAANPQTAFRMTTVADYTFVVNRNVTVTMDSSEVMEVEPYNAIAYVKKGVVSTTYTLNVSGRSVSYTTPDPTTTVEGGRTTSTSTTSGDTTTGTQTSTDTTTTNLYTQPKTTDIAAQLTYRLSLLGLNGVLWTAETINSTILLTSTNGKDFTFRAEDSWGNEAFIGIKREVQKFQDLPAIAFDGFRVKVVGEHPGQDDDYYLEYSSDDFYKNGVWKETRGWNQQNRFDASTMPHILVREADGSFTFKRADWDERKCGDDFSNPQPSFVGEKIQDIFFYRNRLGVIAKENVVLSEAAGFFQFWPDTATTVLATHPIDIAVSNDKVSLLRHALVFEESLVLFADNVQFQLTSGGQAVLSPETVKVDKTTEYNCFDNCSPVHSGRSVYFATEKGDFAGVREYQVESDTVTTVAPEVTSHIPEYLSRDVFKMTVAVNDGTLFLASYADPNRVYVYRYFWVGDEKIQSCWSHWEFHKDATVLSIAVIESSLFLVVQYPDGVHLERIDLNSKGEVEEIGHKIHLDRKVRISGQYNAATDTTFWGFPYTVDVTDAVLVLGPGHADYPAGMTITNLTQESTDMLAASGDWTGAEVIAGVDYEMRYRFSQLFLRTSQDANAAPIQEGRLQLLGMELLFKDSGYFRTEVSTPGREQVVREHNQPVGVFNSFIGKPFIDSGRFRFFILSRNDRATIDIVNPKHYPSCFQSAEWTATYTSDAARR